MSSYMTIGTWIRDRGRLTPERTAIDFCDRTVTYGELDRDSSRLAAELMGRGLGRGDRVAVLADNCPEYVTLFFACAKAGLVMTPLNWRLAPPELAYQVDHSGASVVLASRSRLEQAEQVVAEAEHRPPIRPLEDPPEAEGDVDVVVEDDDPLFLIYTSGTTGRPKGAVLTHANCFWTNTAIDRLMDVTTFDVVLQVLPQFHVGGWNVQPLLAWWKGATVVLEPSFDPGRALRLIEEKRVTTMMGVPANYLFMAEHPSFATTDLSSLRMAVVGGAPMPESLIETWTARGVSLVQGYGLSEASPNVLGLPPEYVKEKVGYAGKAYPHVEVALEGSDGSLIDGPGTGELLVRGPSVFAGYWNDPAATAEAMRGGWLHTGDVAERDADGFYRIRDRIKDMYISGGENVYPAEVESVLMAHPDVVEAAVVGVPDERWGEAGVAVVVTRRPLDPEELLDWCRGRLARFKVPREVRFVDALPRSGMNKVLKREIVEMLEAQR
ncbi:MAG: long-chain fatty acid--CoA ligase [Actinomycetes bacterium]|nr:long-chain-fatty-acid--CoA ligase [Acidimicrobiia bacterium]